MPTAFQITVGQLSFFLSFLRRLIPNLDDAEKAPEHAFTIMHIEVGRIVVSPALSLSRQRLLDTATSCCGDNDEVPQTSTYNSSARHYAWKFRRNFCRQLRNHLTKRRKLIDDYLDVRWHF